MTVSIRECQTDKILIDGDFNCLMSALDKFGGKDVQAKKNVISSVEELCNNYDLVDSWRKQHPYDTRYTWKNCWGKIKCRLDFWLISKQLLGRISKTEIGAYYDSDHSPVSISKLNLMDHRKKEVQATGSLTILFWKMKNLSRK